MADIAVVRQNIIRPRPIYLHGYQIPWASNRGPIGPTATLIDLPLSSRQPRLRQSSPFRGRMDLDRKSHITAVRHREQQRRDHP